MDLYTRLAEMMKGRPSKKLAGSTYVTKEGVTIVVTLYQTKVVQVQPDHSRTFRSGGWLTPTTKDRINEYGLSDLPALRIHATRGVWYLGNYAWAEDIGVNKKGEVVGAALQSGEANRKKVLAFVKRYMAAWLEGKVKTPNGGDPWNLLFASKDGKLPLMHDPAKYFAELCSGDYFPGILLYRAMEFAVGLEPGCAEGSLSAVLSGDMERPRYNCALSRMDEAAFASWMRTGTPDKTYAYPMCVRRLSAMLSTYLLRAFNLPPARS